MFEKADPPTNKFIENFAGVEVEVFTGVMQKSETIDPNGNQTIEEVPLAVRGFIIDVDDKWVYLGDTVHGITKCIANGPGLIVEIVKERSEFDDILDELPTDTQGN